MEPTYSDRTLTNDQRVAIVAWLVERYGLEQVRITGGEPLLHKGIGDLIARLRQLAPALRLALTTHGRLLPLKARELREAGLDRLNISLDSLDPARYERMTGGQLPETLKGIEIALQVGFEPPRLNTVVLRDANDGEIPAMTRWAVSNGYPLRFLEAMPIGPAAEHNREHFVSAREIRAVLEDHFDLTPLPVMPGSTARSFALTIAGVAGKIGIISPVTEPFCGSCGRIRITAEGDLFPCLLDNRSISLRSSWNGTAWDETQLDAVFNKAVQAKEPEGKIQSTSMVTLGG
jgi:cyclic pyranopterin phosphate synthase